MTFISSHFASGIVQKKNSLRVPASVCDVQEFGAKGDGKTLNTKYLQNAIDACAKTGGTVVVSEGVYLTGTIHIKSGIELRIEPSAILRGTQNIEDYPDIIPTSENTQWRSCRKALVFVDNATNVKIHGGGTIDGNGKNPNWKGKEWTRPMALFMAGSKDITIENLKIRESAMWSLVGFETDNIQIRKIDLHSDFGHNRDGIDMVDTHNVLIEESVIFSQDDSICLKSGSPRGVLDVTVRNVRILSSTSANGLKMGTASTGYFKNILFENIELNNVNLAAMAVESVDGGEINNVQFRHIRMNEVGNAFFVILGRRGTQPLPGSLQNITFEDIQGTTNKSWGSAISGSLIEGKSFWVSHLLFKDIKIKSQTGKFLSANEPPEYAGQYPDPNLWGDLPAFGLYIRHTSDVKLQNVSIESNSFYESRLAIKTTDVLNLKQSAE